MSYLAQFRREGDEYFDESRAVNGVPFCLGTWDQAIRDALGFCGCGAPDLALRYVRDILRAIDTPRPEWDASIASHRKWYDETYRPALDAIFHGDQGAEYLAFYLLDDKGLTEHGGSVPGWLTEKGDGVLADLEANDLEDDETPGASPEAETPAGTPERKTP